jgi:hypothetical protein
MITKDFAPHEVQNPSRSWKNASESAIGPSTVSRERRPPGQAKTPIDASNQTTMTSGQTTITSGQTTITSGQMTSPSGSGGPAQRHGYRDGVGEPAGSTSVLRRPA